LKINCLDVSDTVEKRLSIETRPSKHETRKTKNEKR
jgi:hypothetical protein